MELSKETIEHIKVDADKRFPFGHKDYPSHDSNTNARREGYKEGATTEAQRAMVLKEGLLKVINEPPDHGDFDPGAVIGKMIWIAQKALDKYNSKTE